MQIGLLGHGVVGSGVKEIIDNSLSNNTIQIKKILVKDLNSLQDARATIDINDILDDPDIDTIVECIGGLEPAHTYVKNALEKHKNVVTSNKKMLATYALELFELAENNNVSLSYEASVGGGIPWIHECNRISQIDQIDSFRGIMNGTTNYILYSMENDSLSFEQALKNAQEKGYAEKDPTDDICGYDTCYKTSLSAYTCFNTYVNPKAIPTFGIQNIRKDDFAYANSIGATIKLLGKGYCKEHSISLYVIPTFVANHLVESHIPYNFNYFCTNSATLGEASFVGQGAGSLPTAHAVVQDLLDIKNKQTSNTYSNITTSSIYSPCGSFYIHSEHCHLNPLFIEKEIDEHTWITKKVSLFELNPMLQDLDDLFIAEVEE